MKIKALVAVRSGSQRVVNKNIRPFAGSSARLKGWGRPARFGIDLVLTFRSAVQRLTPGQR